MNLSSIRYIETPQSEFWSDTPVGSGTSADVAWSRASTWPMWAEVPGPGGTSDQKLGYGASMYPFKLRFSQIYKIFRDLVVYPNMGIFLRYGCIKT